METLHSITDVCFLNILFFEFQLHEFHSFRERKIFDIFETISCAVPLI
jgi:hypothetical protein